MAETHDWSGFDTDAHRTAQAGCNHLIHCAVDAATRAAVNRNLDNARSTGDANGVLLQLAQLTGPCRLPPGNPPVTGTVPAARSAQGTTQAGSTPTEDDDDAAM
jgi:hypothetical protein